MREVEENLIDIIFIRETGDIRNNSINCHNEFEDTIEWCEKEFGGNYDIHIDLCGYELYKDEHNEGIPMYINVINDFNKLMGLLKMYYFLPSGHHFTFTLVETNK